MSCSKVRSIIDYGAREDNTDNTVYIQAAIDACAPGDTVFFPRGSYTLATVWLKSNITLEFDDGVTILGSENYKDYCKSETWDWNSAIFRANDCENITVKGRALLDGRNCFCPLGEEGFRGPHMFVIYRSKNLNFEGLTVKDCANYTFLFVVCSNVSLRNIEMIAGHDGIHSQRGSDFVIDGCIFRTGDDSIAGSDNVNFTVKNCRINSACNGLRFGCNGMDMSDCVFQGPGEYMHRLEGRLSSLYAFDHFAPIDRKSHIPTDNWTIRNIKADRMLSLFRLDRNENWQEACPAYSIIFEDAEITNMQEPIRVFCRGSRDTSLTFRRCKIATDPTLPPMPVFEMEDFNCLTLEDTVLDNGGKVPQLLLKNGKLVTNGSYQTESSDLETEEIK